MNHGYVYVVWMDSMDYVKPRDYVFVVGLGWCPLSRQVFNGFVKTNGENNGNHKSDHENIPTFDYKKFSSFVNFLGRHF